MVLKLSLALVAALLAVLPYDSTAIEYTVTTCTDLADVDDTLVTSLIIDSSTFACDEYTRFRVRNGMLLKATGPTVAFDNFAMKVLGELTVEPDVSFTGVNDEVREQHASEICVAHCCAYSKHQKAGCSFPLKIYWLQRIPSPGERLPASRGEHQHVGDSVGLLLMAAPL